MTISKSAFAADLGFPPFLQGEGEMLELIRTYDWNNSPIGPINSWTSGLTSILGVMLHTKFPMFLFWGSELICFYNDPFRPSLGIDGKHPALGKKGIEVWAEIWEFIGPMIDQVMTSGIPVWFEDQLVPFYRNGRIEDIYWTFSYSPAYGDGGKIVGVVVICTETTQKVNLLKVITESEEQLKFAIDAVDLGTWDMNPSTNKFVGNNRLRDWFGMESLDEMYLSQALNNIVDRDRERVVQAINMALSPVSGGKYDIEYTIVNPKTKQERRVRAKGKALFDQKGLPQRLSGTLQDVSKETQAKKELAENKQNLQLAIEIGELGIFFIDLTDHLAICSPLILNWFNLPAECTELSYFQSKIHPDDRAWVIEKLNQSVEGENLGKHDFIYRLDYQGKTGLKFVRSIGQVIYEQGKAIGISGIIQDVTEQHEFSEALEKKVAERTRELAHANNRLQQSNIELNQFAYVASHDLQEPLRKVRTFSELLELNLENISPKASYYLERIQVSTNRMQNLIEDVLRFSILSNETEKMDRVDLNNLLVTIVSDYELLIDKLGARVILGELPVIEAIPFQMRQLFSNLLSNALKFIRPDRPPLIEVYCSAVTNHEMILRYNLNSRINYWQIEIRDNGIGFSQEHADQIFGLFKRLHGKTEFEGTGIGLAICNKIMQNHQGLIYAQSDPKIGSSFFILIPASFAVPVPN